MGGVGSSGPKPLEEADWSEEDWAAAGGGVRVARPRASEEDRQSARRPGRRLENRLILV